MNLLLLTFSSYQPPVRLFPLEEITYMENCYSDASVLEFDPNRQEFVARLVGLDNSACNAFPRGVVANLTLASEVIPRLITVDNEYSYSEYHEFVFDIPDTVDLELFDQEFYAELVIFDYRLATRVEFFVLEEIKSSLSNCFDVWSSLTFGYDETHFPKMKLFLNPTGLCTGEFEDSGDSHLISVSIEVNEYAIDLDRLEFIDLYENEGSDIEIIDELNFFTYMQLRTNAFFSSEVDVLNQNGDDVVSFSIPIFEVIVDNPEYIGFEDGLFRTSLVSAQNNSFTMILEFNSYYDNNSLNVQLLEELFEEIGDFETISIKLCIMNSLTGDELELTKLFEKDEYILPSYFTFDCLGNETKLSDFVLCKEFYDSAVNQYISIYSQLRFKVLVSFENNAGDYFLILHKDLKYYFSCSSSHYFSILDKDIFSINVVPDTNRNCEELFPSSGIIDGELKIYYSQSNHSFDSLFLMFDTEYNIKETSYICECNNYADTDEAIACKSLFQVLEKEKQNCQNYFSIIFESEIIDELIMISQSVLIGNYKTNNIISIVVGSSYIVSIISISIFLLIETQKYIISLKKYKKEKKQE